MSLRTKKILVGVSIVVLLAGILIYYLVNRQQTESTLTALPISQPDIPTITSGYSIETTVKESDFRFPKTLPLIIESPTNPLAETEILAIAQNFGFEGKPITANDITDGKTYIWVGESDSLTVYAASRKIIYALNEAPIGTNKQLSDPAIIDTSLNFLVSKSLIPSKNAVSFSYFTFNNTTDIGQERLDITDKQNADLYITNFSPLKMDAKLMTVNPLTSPVSVWLNREGVVVKAIVQKLGDFAFSNEKYPVKTYADLLATLQSASLVSLDEGNIDQLKITDNYVKSITVSKIEIAYLKDQKNSEILQPIFLLEGVATLTDKTVPALLYLPAIKN